MSDFLQKMKNNKIQFLKFVITLSVIYFFFATVNNIIDNLQLYFLCLVMIYSMFYSLLSLISEFSPFILHNYIEPFFPFFTNYFGRSLVYLCIGSIYITPEVGKLCNIAGVLYVIIGVLCLLMYVTISSANQVQNKDLTLLAKNYDDFSTCSNRESLNLPLTERNKI